MTNTVYHPEYIFKTKPYAHQLEALDLSRDKTAFALLMEMGTGKSKVVIDTTTYLHGKGSINGLLVIAPNGVHRNWILEEVPIHLPDSVEHVSAYWTASPRKHELAAMAQMTKVEAHVLRIFAMNVESFSTPKGKAVARKFLNLFDTLMVVDESSDISNIGAKRSEAVVHLGTLAKYRRILNGTPITRGPLDLYSQFQFLDPFIFGYQSYYAFRNHFAEWEKRYKWDRDSKGKRVKRFFKALKCYKNMDELSDVLQKHSYRALKEDCLDLPPKIYERRYIDLTKEQKRMYKKMREEVIVALVHDKMAGKINAELAITKLLRLAQVTGGYLTMEELGTGNTKVIEIVPPEKNPKMQETLKVCNQVSGKIVIWARFIGEIEGLAKVMRKEFGSRAVVTYYGKMDDIDRVDSIKNFQNDPEVRVFIGQVQSGIGFTITAGTTVIYYSNDFSLRRRLQSEDRTHRIGQTQSVLYVDLEAQGTVDSKVINTLRENKEIADEIVDGQIRDWL